MTNETEMLVSLLRQRDALKAALIEALDIAEGPPMGHFQAQRLSELRKLAEALP